MSVIMATGNSTKYVDLQTWQTTHVCRTESILHPYLLEFFISHPVILFVSVALFCNLLLTFHVLLTHFLQDILFVRPIPAQPQTTGSLLLLCYIGGR